jgi:hypothetical protein
MVPLHLANEGTQMGTTNFDWLEVSGVPTFGMGGGPYKPFSDWIFVDPDNVTNKASNGNPGTADAPVTTMARAFTLCGSGGVISFIGNVREQITAPLGLFDVTIVGCGNSPRHADAFDGKAGYTAATWRPEATPVVGTPLLTIQSQGWRLINFLMTTGVSGQPLLKIARNSESGDDEIDGGHASVYGMRFDGAPVGIQVATTGFIGVYNSYFRGMTTAAINTVAGGPGSNGFWNIVGNRFMDNATHIIAPLLQSTISQNVFGTCTMGIDLTNGSLNVVGPGNVLFGNYNNLYSPGTNDTWAGNFQIAGITTANPT